jgi:hypothetical protein
LVPAVLSNRKAHQRECVATEVLSKDNHSVFPLPCVGNSCYHCSIRISKILLNHRQLNLNQSNLLLL